MKSFFAVAAAIALSAVFTAPTEAQTVSGQVNIHGFVAPRCGSTLNADTTFNGTINLGELTQTNGTLNSTFVNSTTTSPVGTAAFLIGCTGGGANVSLSATRLTNPTAPELPSSSNHIDYTAEIKIALGTGGFAYVDYTTAAALPAATAQTISTYFAQSPGNFEVRVFGLAAENGTSSLLVAGSYDSAVTITVSPAG